MKNKIKAFSLIEILVALALLSIIGLYLIPSSLNLYRDSVRLKKSTEEIFAVEAALEKSRTRPIGTYSVYVNNKEVMVTVSPYRQKDGLNLIKATCGQYELKLIGESHEKGL